jgi:hypothetical protein
MGGGHGGAAGLPLRALCFASCSREGCCACVREETGRGRRRREGRKREEKEKEGKEKKKIWKNFQT